MYEDRDKERCLLLHKNYKENHLQEVTDLKQINENNKILIIGEQGFGDQLMICHYLSRLSLLGYRITYLVNEKLYNVIRNIKELKNIKIIKNVNEQDLNLYSYKIYSMSLPFLFYKSKIKRKPVKIDDINFTKVYKKYPKIILKLMDNKKLNVGIAWSGRCTQTRNSFRSVRLSFLKQIFKMI